MKNDGISQINKFHDIEEDTLTERDMIKLSPIMHANFDFIVGNNRKDFISKFNIPTSTITRIKAGVISYGHLKHICKTLDIEIDDFCYTYLYPEHQKFDILGEHYFGYFFSMETGTIIDKIDISIKKDSNIEIKMRKETFKGKVYLNHNYIYFDFKSLNEDYNYRSYITLLKPNIGKKYKYSGGVGFICLPTGQETSSSTKKIVLSYIEYDIDNKSNIMENDHKFLVDILRIRDKNNEITLSRYDDIKVCNWNENRDKIPYNNATKSNSTDSAYSTEFNKTRLYQYAPYIEKTQSQIIERSFFKTKEDYEKYKNLSGICSFPVDIQIDDIPKNANVKIKTPASIVIDFDRFGRTSLTSNEMTVRINNPWYSKDGYWTNTAYIKIYNIDYVEIIPANEDMFCIPIQFEIEYKCLTDDVDMSQAYWTVNTGAPAGYKFITYIDVTPTNI